MHNNLYEFVCDELRDLDEKARRGDVKMGDVEYADKLEHYKKSKLTNTAMENEGFSGRYDGRAYDDGMGSMARGRVNPPRDAMGRYSGRYAYDSGLSTELRRLMPMAQDDQTRMEMQRLADRIDRG